jgi:hypothetical protein
MLSVPLGLGSAEVFGKPPSTMLSLSGPEFQQWMLMFMVKHSDVSSAELVSALKSDDGALDQLTEYGTRLARSLKLASQCKVKEVLSKVLEYFIHKGGDTLLKFKADGGINPDGSLNWRHGSYLLGMNGSKIVEVIHKVSGAKVDISSLGLDSHYQLTENWSEVSAALVRKPLPPVRLSTLFSKKNKEGPWKADDKEFKAQAFQKVCVAIADEWDRVRRLASDGCLQTEALSTKAQLDEMQSEKRKAISHNAREKAMAALAAKKQRRTISLAEKK